MRTSLMQHEFTFCVKFLLCSLLYKLKLPNSSRGVLCLFKLKGLDTSQHLPFAIIDFVFLISCMVSKPICCHLMGFNGTGLLSL